MKIESKEVFALRAIAKRVTEQKIPHKQLAEICGVSDSTISSWLSGKTYVPAVMLPRIAAALSCSAADFFGEESDFAQEETPKRRWRYHEG